eukprot:875127_1
MTVKGIYAILLTFAILINDVASKRSLKNRFQLVKCSDTAAVSNSLQTYWHDTVCPGTWTNSQQKVCGGDTLDEGAFNVRVKLSAKDVMRVYIKGANKGNLYSVYFLPFGGNPCSEKVFVGEFTTDSNGDSTGKVRDCGAKGDPSNTPVCVNRFLGGRPTVADIGSLAKNGGTFLVYSRGPWANIDGTINTSDGTLSGTFNNPELWGGFSGQFDRIQFVTGLS